MKYAKSEDLEELELGQVGLSGLSEMLHLTSSSIATDNLGSSFNGWARC